MYILNRRGTEGKKRLNDPVFESRRTRTRHVLHSFVIKETYYRGKSDLVLSATCVFCVCCVLCVCMCVCVCTANIRTQNGSRRLCCVCDCVIV